MNPLRAWRERGWEVADAEAYAQTWARFGGSVATHPDFVERLSALAGFPVRYLVRQQGGECVAALATWGPYVALSRDCLKRRGRKGLFDLGNAEVIVPMAPEAQVPLRHRARYLSALSAPHLTGVREQAEGLALVRPPEDYNAKYLSTQRRKQRKLLEAGGTLTPVRDLEPAELARIYTRLFELRWGFAVPGKAHLVEVLGLLREFLTGWLVSVHGEPVAVQVVYQVESPQWISTEYINGGVDPSHEALSPGSVLLFANTQSAWNDARERGKALRYSFGRADREYKDRWCHRVPVYCS